MCAPAATSCASARLASLDALSTTIISSAGQVCARQLSRVIASVPTALRQGMMMETSGVAESLGCRGILAKKCSENRFNPSLLNVEKHPQVFRSGT